MGKPGKKLIYEFLRWITELIIHPWENSLYVRVRFSLMCPLGVWINFLLVYQPGGFLGMMSQIFLTHLLFFPVPVQASPTNFKFPILVEPEPIGKVSYFRLVHNSRTAISFRLKW